MNNINAHSRLHLRYTSDPKCLGYAATVEHGRQAIAAYLSDTPDFIGTPRQILDKCKEIRRMYGDGTFYRIDITTKDGQELSLSDIRDYVAECDYFRNRSRKKGGRV